MQILLSKIPGTDRWSAAGIAETPDEAASPPPPTKGQLALILLGAAHTLVQASVEDAAAKKAHVIAVASAAQRRILGSG